MRLLLCSQGLSTPKILEQCVALCDKPQEEIRVALISETSTSEEADKRRIDDELRKVSDYFPGRVNSINLLALSIDDVQAYIASCDLLYVVGDSADYLMSVFAKTGFANILPALLKTKVYVGSGAGSMVVGRRLSSDTRRLVFEGADAYGTEKFLELMDIALVLHLNSLPYKGRTQKLLEAVTKESGKVCGLQDDSALVVEGTKQEVIGSMPLMSVMGNVVMSPGQK